MRRFLALGTLAGAVAAGAPDHAVAQESQPSFLAVGEMAPDFQLVGATRYGILEQPIRLSDYRGETVVLAFFFRARSPG